MKRHVHPPKRLLHRAFQKTILGVGSVLLGLSVAGLSIQPALATDVTTPTVVADTETEIADYGPLPTPAQLQYHQEELAAFIHFGMNTFTDAEWGNGRENVSSFNPTDLDADQWIRVLKETGFKRTIMVVKHHDGFVLYPSAHTEHDVASSPWKNGQGDVLLEVSEAATRHDMNLGVYLSPWDAHHPKYKVATQDQYNEYYLNQLKEILGDNRYGNHGKFVEVWMDGARGSGAAAVTYNFDEWFRYIREQEGDITIFSAEPTSVRWIGNERGIAGDPVWHKVNPDTIRRGPSNAYLNNGDPAGTLYSVGEADVSIRPGWFYHANQQPKSLRQLMDIYFKSVGRGTPLLLNIPPDTRGQFAEVDIERLREFYQTIQTMYANNLAAGKTVTAGSTRGHHLYQAAHLTDGDDNTVWAPAGDATTAQFTLDLGEAQTFDVIELKEFIQKGQRISGFEIEVQVNGQWLPYGSGHTVGYRRLIQNQPVSARYIRVRITGAQATPILNNIAVYKVPKSIEKTDGYPLGLNYVSNTEGVRHGTWHNESEGVRGTSQWTNQQGASVEYTFTGTKAYVVSTVDPNHSVMEIYVDDVKVGEVDTARSPRKRSQLVYETEDLSPGEHRIKLVNKNRSAIATEGIFVLNNESKGMIDFAQPSYDVVKGEEAVVTLRRVGGSHGETSVKVITEPGTGVHGKVYRDTTKVITFAEGETEKTVRIPTIAFTEQPDATFDFYVKIESIAEGVLTGFNRDTVVNVMPEHRHPERISKVDDRDAKLDYHGTWNDGTGSAHYAGTEKWTRFRDQSSAEAKQDVSVTVYFKGSGIRAIGTTDPGHGIYDVILDGQAVRYEDTLGHGSLVDGQAYFSGKSRNRTGNQNLVSLHRLEDGLHSLTLRLSPERNDLNSNIAIQLDRFELIGKNNRLLSKAELLEEVRSTYGKVLAAKARVPAEKLAELAEEFQRLEQLMNHEDAPLGERLEVLNSLMHEVAAHQENRVENESVADLSLTARGSLEVNDLKLTIDRLAEESVSDEHTQAAEGADKENVVVYEATVTGTYAASTEFVLRLPKEQGRTLEKVLHISKTRGVETLTPGAQTDAYVEVTVRDLSPFILVYAPQNTPAAPVTPVAPVDPVVPVTPAKPTTGDEKPGSGASASVVIHAGMGWLPSVSDNTPAESEKDLVPNTGARRNP